MSSDEHPLWPHTHYMRSLQAAVCIVMAVASLAVSLATAIYGGRVFFLISRVPLESTGKRKKLKEVCYVASVPIRNAQACMLKVALDTHALS